MVVIAIIGLLAAIALPKFGDVSSQAKVANVQGNLATSRTAISMFYAKTDTYPNLTIEDGAGNLKLVTAKDVNAEDAYFTDFYNKTVMAETPSGKVGTTTVAASNAIVATGSDDGGWVYTVTDGTILADLATGTYVSGTVWDEQ
jgi:type II secretory pathway pseudopilin PulG